MHEPEYGVAILPLGGGEKVPVVPAMQGASASNAEPV